MVYGLPAKSTQVVEFHGVTSNPEGVSIGVPQGPAVIHITCERFTGSGV